MHMGLNSHSLCYVTQSKITYIYIYIIKFRSVAFGLSVNGIVLGKTSFERWQPLLLCEIFLRPIEHMH